MDLKIYAWNMQRGSSISNDSVKAKLPQTIARLRTLEYICDIADVVLLNEVGKDLQDAVADAKNVNSCRLPGGFGYWTSSKKPDGQTNNGCRNLIFSKLTLKQTEILFKSGNGDCFRYPAAGIHSAAGGVSILFVSLHATSGGAGGANSRGIFDELDEKNTALKMCDVAIIGGDMNSNNSHFLMPDDPTHQSGNKLDGFSWAEGNLAHTDSLAGVRFGVQSYKATVLKIENKFKLVCGGSSSSAASASAASANIAVQADDSGNTGDQTKGFLVFDSNSRLWGRASDHAPVLAELTIQKISEWICKGGVSKSGRLITPSTRAAEATEGSKAEESENDEM